MSKFPKQLIPLIIIFVITIAALIAARTILVPKSFGEKGHYRADAVPEIMSLPQVYAGVDVCNDCHDDIVETKAESHHKGVACEACHGPALAHAEAPDEVIPKAPRGRGFCPTCHGYNPSRPTGFPQIIPERHNPGKPCMSCHNPHNPLLPHTPAECDACHRDIASVKMLSHHASLECTQCHKVDKGHKTSPEFAKAHKPTDNSTCAHCHANGSTANQYAPKIDIDAHAGRYYCWDCHYPHYPEAN